MRDGDWLRILALFGISALSFYTARKLSQVPVEEEQEEKHAQLVLFPQHTLN